MPGFGPTAANDFQRSNLTKPGCLYYWKRSLLSAMYLGIGKCYINGNSHKILDKMTSGMY